MFDSCEISHSLNHRRYQIQSMFDRIKTLESGETLYISDVDEVIANFGRKDRFNVTEEWLVEVETKRMNVRDMFECSKQLVSACMFGMRVTCVGLESSEKMHIAKLVILLGGRYVSDYDNCTVLVAREAISLKVFRASQHAVNVVLPEWIEDCFEKRGTVPEARYRLGKFSACIVTSSDLTPIQRRNVAKAVRAGGGVWSDVFDRTVQCVIANSVSPTTKIRLAMEADVPVMSVDWALKDIVPAQSSILNPWCCCGEKTSLFAGQVFSISEHVCERVQLVRAIEMNGGVVGCHATISVIPHGKASSDDKESSVTSRWVWACISKRRIVNKHDSPSFTPRLYQCPVRDCVGKTCALMNMDDDTRLEIAGVLRDIGMTVVFSLTKTANIILAQRLTDELEDFSYEYDIPILSISWAAQLAENGKWPSLRAHHISSDKSMRRRRLLDLNAIEETMSSPESQLSTLNLF